MKEKVWPMIKFAFSEVNTILGVVGAFLTVICLIDVNALFPELLTRVLLVIIIFTVAFLASLIKTVMTKKISVDLGDGRKGSVEFGDLFEKADQIVIPVNDSFDTQVDDILIAKGSVHGQFVTRLFERNVNDLNRMIERELKGIESAGTYGEEKSGNKIYYPLGTAITIITAGKTYYLVALTHFEKNVVKPDLQGYYAALLSLIGFLNERTAGRPVYLPLLGSGLARLGREKELMLENILTVLRMSETAIVGELCIVLHRSDWGKINLHKFTGGGY